MVSSRNKPAPDPSPAELPEGLEHDEFVQSYKVVKRLLPFLAKRGIPASPKNYRIFFDYLLYSNPALNKTVNELLDNNAKFYKQLTATIYDQFYSGETVEFQTQAINKATSDFMALSSDMQESLQSAINQTSHYQKILTDTTHHMSKVTTPDELQPFLNDLMSETETALAHHDSFSVRINEANNMIVSLKAELQTQTSLATVDELTKLNNRRHLNIEAPKLIARAAKTGTPFSLIIFDLDFFKRINDTWGHNYGDKVLILCAGIIKESARTTDLAVRLGGEEFLLVLPGLGLNTAAQVAERVRHSIATTKITIRGDTLPVTISGGAAELRSGEDMTDLIGRADKALYRAKQSGRNKICLAEAGMFMGG